MPYFLTRLNVGNYEAWKPNFDEDGPGARRDAKRHVLLRNVENPAEVFILVEFASVDDARSGRERLMSSGLLDRFADKSLPVIVEEAESRVY